MTSGLTPTERRVNSPLHQLLPLLTISSLQQICVFFALGLLLSHLYEHRVTLHVPLSHFKLQEDLGPRRSLTLGSSSVPKRCWTVLPSVGPLRSCVHAGWSERLCSSRPCSFQGSASPRTQLPLHPFHLYLPFGFLTPSLTLLDSD